MERRPIVIGDRAGRALAATALAIALVTATAIACAAVIRIKGDQRDYSLEVTGSAKRTVHADHLEWRSALEAKVARVSDGHADLERARNGIATFLAASGIPAEDVRLGAPEVQELFAYDGKRRTHQGYLMTQSVIVETRAKEALFAAAAQTTELIQAAGIAGAEYVWKPGELRYIYRSFDELKQSVLAEATENGRVRARAMATAAGTDLGRLRQAAFGDIEIRSPSSQNRYSDDESSPVKDIIANVKLLYLIR